MSEKNEIGIRKVSARKRSLAEVRPIRRKVGPRTRRVKHFTGG